MAKVYTDKKHMKEDMEDLYDKMIKESAYHGDTPSADYLANKKLGHQTKDKLWIHREPKWNIKKKVFMHKIREVKY